MAVAITNPIPPGTMVRVIQRVARRESAWTTIVEGEVLSHKLEPTGSWFDSGRWRKVSTGFPFSRSTMPARKPPMTFTEKQKVGRIGEDIACKFLMKHGFEVADRNYLRKWGEIDIIAKKRGVLHSPSSPSCK